MHEEELSRLLRQWLDETGAPGISVAVDDGRTIRCLVAGVADPLTRTPVSAHFAFQFGSVSKMVTAFLLIEALADRGLDLETLAVAIAPDLAASNDLAFHSVTARHLLNHTSGLDSQWWADMGQGGEARRAAARAIVALPMIARPGDLFSYSNSGYVLAGYLTEVLTGQIWEAFAEDRIARYLGDHSLSARAETFLVRPTATGHDAPPSEGAPALPAARWYAPVALAPGGGLAGTPADLARLLRVLRGRLGPNQRPSLVPTIGWRYAGWAPGIARYGFGEKTFAWGHDGTTVGQACAVRLCEGRPETVVVATNAAWTAPRVGRLADKILRTVTATPDPGAFVEPLAGYEDWTMPPEADPSGCYARLNATLTVAMQPNDELLLAEAYSPQDALHWFGAKTADAAGPAQERLRQCSPHSFAAADKELHFLRHPKAPGRLYAHDGMRATPKSTRFWL
ncbi:serine hydrolase domain-containing protein [Ensifer sp. 2YAB10]|uniref:serine hydrolase domain-containing protein n=1 Tax=unclassified Ensifer TaxID=2633371 RepID=UPI003F93C0EA